MIAIQCDRLKWHGAWKETYHGFNGWKTGCPVELAGRTCIVDALSYDGSIRGFVHSLANEDNAKHAFLKDNGANIMLISYGDVFASERRHKNRGGGYYDFLNTMSYCLHERLGAKVHFEGQIWSLWKKNIWYPEEGNGWRDLLNAFSKVFLQKDITDAIDFDAPHALGRSTNITDV